MVGQFLNTSYFSVQWKTFTMISAVLIVLVMLFVFHFSSTGFKQFESERKAVYSQNKQQLDSLVATTADQMIQLASASTLNLVFMDAVYSQDVQTLEHELEQLSWNFQLDAGIDGVAIHNQFGRLLFQTGSDFSEELIKKVIRTDASQWRVMCELSCSIQVGMPLLHKGQVIGLMLLAQPLSHVMLKFQQVANINTGLLSPKPNNEEFDQFIPSWGQNLVALTNPQNSSQIVVNASEQFSLKELNHAGKFVDLGNQVFELRALNFEGQQMIVISDASEDVSSFEAYKSDVLLASILALVVAESLLLVFLWRPLSRVKHDADSIPLPEGEQYFDDSDLIESSSETHYDELKHLEHQLAIQAQALAQKTKALDHAEMLSNTLMDNMSAAVMIQDEKICVVSSNKYLVRLLGVSSTSLCGKPFSELTEAVGGNKWLSERLQDVLDGVLSEFQHESRVTTKQGMDQYLNWRHVPMYDGFTGQRQILSVAMPIKPKH